MWRLFAARLCTAGRRLWRVKKTAGTETNDAVGLCNDAVGLCNKAVVEAGERWYNENMEKSERKQKGDKGKNPVRTGAQKMRAKLLGSYYKNPAKKLKLIAITGTTGKVIVAHFVHEILRAAGEQVAVLASEQPFSTRTLHKFLSDAWKAGAQYVVVTVPAEGLRDNVFYGLPVTVAAMTNFVTAGLNDMTPEEFLEDEKTLFDMKPEIVVLNEDDLNYKTFAEFRGSRETLTFGLSGEDVRILTSKLYPKGTEATLAIRSEVVPVASFVAGETTVSYMASAAAIAHGLGVSTQFIIEGIAEYAAE